MNRKTPFALAFAAALSLGLAACSARSDEPSPMENSTEVDTTVNDEPSPIETETAAPEPAPVVAADTNTTAEALPEPATARSPDQQMLDDASATGMTSRTSRNQPATDGATSAEPVEQQ